MRYLIVFALLVVPAALVSRPLRAEEKAAEAKPARAAFERLKKLAGEWVDGEGRVTLSWRVVSAGSALVETVLPGTPHEMITVYFMDGDDLVLTHYCACENQPRLRAVAPFDGKTLRFELAGGTNVDVTEKGCCYMGDLAMTLDGDDHLQEVWGVYKGKARTARTHSFDVRRKR